MDRHKLTFEEENKRLKEFIANNEIILKSVHTDVKQITDYVDKILGLVKKLLSAFPETIPDNVDEMKFDIPAYIVEELRHIVEASGAKPK